MARIPYNLMTSLNMSQMTVSPTEYLFAPLPTPAFLTVRWAHTASSGQWTVSGIGLSRFQPSVIQSLRSFPVYCLFPRCCELGILVLPMAHYEMDAGHLAT